MQCCCQSEPDSKSCCCCCCCNTTKKLAKGKFGLAYIVETPKNRCIQPIGWQVEFEDTPSRISNNCNKMVNWVNCPPLGCLCSGTQTYCNGNPDACVDLLESYSTKKKCCCRAKQTPAPCYSESINNKNCCCKCGKKRRRRKQNKCECSDSSLDDRDSLDYIPKRDAGSKREKQIQSKLSKGAARSAGQPIRQEVELEVYDYDTPTTSISPQKSHDENQYYGKQENQDNRQQKHQRNREHENQNNRQQEYQRNREHNNNRQQEYQRNREDNNSRQEEHQRNRERENSSNKEEEQRRGREYDYENNEGYENQKNKERENEQDREYDDRKNNGDDYEGNSTQRNANQITQNTSNFQTNKNRKNSDENKDRGRVHRGSLLERIRNARHKQIDEIHHEQDELKSILKEQLAQAHAENITYEEQYTDL